VERGTSGTLGCGILSQQALEGRQNGHRSIPDVSFVVFDVVGVQEAEELGIAD
jgi:hypothetical protein